MNNTLKFSVIVPVYNEEKTVKNIILELQKQIFDLGVGYEIIAVDDGSLDNSLGILKSLNNIKVISHSRNRGYGASLKTGIRKSKYDWILIIDSDGTYPTEAIPRLVKYAGDYDMVIGSRVKKGNAIPFERKHAKKFLNKFASYLAGKKIPDLNSGLRIFKKEIVLKYWELFPDKFSFTSTLTMACLAHGRETKFIPIDYYKREGKSSIRSIDFFNFLKLVFKLSLFFKPIKVFFPLSMVILFLALIVPLLYIFGATEFFLDTTFIILCATALQTFFFGLLAEIVIHSK